MTPAEEMHLRRAKVMYLRGCEQYDRVGNWDDLALFLQRPWLDRARAIHASDTAAGLVVAPREVLTGILEYFDPNEHYPPDAYYKIVDILGPISVAPEDKT